MLPLTLKIQSRRSPKCPFCGTDLLPGAVSTVTGFVCCTPCSTARMPNDAANVWNAWMRTQDYSCWTISNGLILFTPSELYRGECNAFLWAEWQHAHKMQDRLDAAQAAEESEVSL